MRLCSVLLSLAFGHGLCAQGVEGIPDLEPEIRDGIMMMPSTERALEHYGYALTQEALESALRDPRAEVRSLAADKLARERKTGALPALVEAFSAERATGTQMWLSYALGTLGDDRGIWTLKGLCRDEGDPDPLHRAAVRSFAAGFMTRLHNKGCYDDAIDVLRFTGSLPAAPGQTASLVVAFSRVAALEGASEPQCREIRELAERFLADDRGDVRMSASNVLGRYGDAGSVQKLKGSRRRARPHGSHADGSGSQGVGRQGAQRGNRQEVIADHRRAAPARTSSR